MYTHKEVIAFLKTKLGEFVRYHLVAVADENPLLLPLPPGMVVRLHKHHPTLGRILQVRDRACLPDDWYMVIRKGILWRHCGEFSLN